MSAATPGGGMSAWRGAEVEPGEGKPDPAEWRPVDLPGRPAVFAGAERVAYRTTVSDPGAAMAVLRLDGLYSGGTVRLDGERVATAESVLDPVRVPFEPAGETELLVTCDAPDDRFGGIHDTDRVAGRDAVGVVNPAEAVVRGVTGHEQLRLACGFERDPDRDEDVLGRRDALAVEPDAPAGIEPVET